MPIVDCESFAYLGHPPLTKYSWRALHIVGNGSVFGSSCVCVNQHSRPAETELQTLRGPADPTLNPGLWFIVLGWLSEGAWGSLGDWGATGVPSEHLGQVKRTNHNMRCDMLICFWQKVDFTFVLSMFWSAWINESELWKVGIWKCWCYVLIYKLLWDMQ